MLRSECWAAQPTTPTPATTRISATLASSRTAAAANTAPAVAAAVHGHGRRRWRRLCSAHGWWAQLRLHVWHAHRRQLQGPVQLLRQSTKHVASAASKPATAVAAAAYPATAISAAVSTAHVSRHRLDHWRVRRGHAAVWLLLRWVHHWRELPRDLQLLLIASAALASARLATAAVPRVPSLGAPVHKWLRYQDRC
jgi:hypothetical protein